MTKFGKPYCNCLYKDVEIDEGELHQLDSNLILPFHIEHIATSHATKVSTSGYDPSTAPPTVTINESAMNSDSSNSNHPDSYSTDIPVPSEIPFSSVVITDVDNVVSSSQLAAAAIHHLCKKGGAYIQILHD